jgi:HNH endonuclease
MNCIFCDQSNQKSKEHIIPENISGTITIDNVCKGCNDIFRSEVDNKLIENLYIHDAYQKLKKRGVDLKLIFKYKDAFITLPDGTKIKVSRRSNEEKTLTNRINEDKFIYDTNDPKFIIDIIKSKKKDKNISNKSISEYLNWNRNENSSKLHEDKLFHYISEKRIDEVKYNYIMQGETPLRFIAKACVEFAYLFGISNNIKNINELKIHALKNIQDTNLKYHQEINNNIAPIPFHIIAFKHNQFIISLFAQVNFSVDILWSVKPLQLLFANNLIKKKLVYCEEINGKLKLTNKEYIIDNSN